jgi:hypothetical protein
LRRPALLIEPLNASPELEHTEERLFE